MGHFLCPYILSYIIYFCLSIQVVFLCVSFLQNLFILITLWSNKTLFYSTYTLLNIFKNLLNSLTGHNLLRNVLIFSQVNCHSLHLLFLLLSFSPFLLSFSGRNQDLVMREMSIIIINNISPFYKTPERAIQASFSLIVVFSIRWNII